MHPFPKLLVAGSNPLWGKELPLNKQGCVRYKSICKLTMNFDFPTTFYTYIHRGDKMFKVIGFLLLILSWTISMNNTFGVQDKPNVGDDIQRLEYEIKVLQTGIQNLKEYEENLHSLFYWLIGTLIAVFAIIIGVNWFFYMKFYEKEVERLDRRYEEQKDNFTGIMNREVSIQIERTLKDDLNEFKVYLGELKTFSRDKDNLVNRIKKLEQHPFGDREKG